MKVLETDCEECQNPLAFNKEVREEGFYVIEDDGQELVALQS
jgi:hypothetical protein